MRCSACPPRPGGPAAPMRGALPRLRAGRPPGPLLCLLPAFTNYLQTSFNEPQLRAIHWAAGHSASRGDGPVASAICRGRSSGEAKPAPASKRGGRRAAFQGASWGAHCVSGGRAKEGAVGRRAEGLAFHAGARSTRHRQDTMRCGHAQRHSPPALPATLLRSPQVCGRAQQNVCSCWLCNWPGVQGLCSNSRFYISQGAQQGCRLSRGPFWSARWPRQRRGEWDKQDPRPRPRRSRPPHGARVSPGATKNRE